MINYPLDTESRLALRGQHIQRAISKSLHIGQSIRCSRNDHHRGDGDGCQNDGTGCLCWCHDQDGA